MQEQVTEGLVAEPEAITLDGVKEQVLAKLKGIRQKNPGAPIWYVAGEALSANGQTGERLRQLRSLTTTIREIDSYPTFSDADIFSEEALDALRRGGLTDEAYVRFWGDILSKGLITHVIVNPPWGQSRLVHHQCEIAKRLGIPVLYKWVRKKF